MNEYIDLIWDKLDDSWKDYLETHEDDARPLPQKNRGSWFCPVVNRIDAQMIRSIANAHGVKKIYDMGAGDLRLSYWLAEQGFDVTAYETIADHPNRAKTILGEPTFELRIRDYYLDFARLIKQNHSLFVFMGGTNHPPSTDKGLIIEGYWEVGSRFWKHGKRVKEW